MFKIIFIWRKLRIEYYLIHNTIDTNNKIIKAIIIIIRVDKLQSKHEVIRRKLNHINLFNCLSLELSNSLLAFQVT